MTIRTIGLLVLVALGAYVAAPRADVTLIPASAVTLPAVTFATLPAAVNGTIEYCSDCTEVTPASCPATQASCVCAAAGTGAFARRAAGAWYCTF